jgi:phage-related minor tail protein
MSSRVQVSVRRQLAVTLVAVCGLAVPVLGACGGGGSSGSGSSSDTPAAPGANVDPNATGYIGGSVNKAKAVAADSEQRDAQLEQQGGGGQP